MLQSGVLSLAKREQEAHQPLPGKQPPKEQAMPFAVSEL